MKKVLQSLAIATLLLTGCKKEDADTFTLDPTRPDDQMHLTATPAEPLMLNESNSNDVALTFAWAQATNRGEGTSITYRFQLSLQGGSATWEADNNNTMQQQRSISFTHEELNVLLTETLGATPDEPAILDAKVVAEVTASIQMQPEISTVSVTVTPYGEKKNINGELLLQMGDNESSFSVDLNINQNGILTVGGMDISDWWIDPDFFTRTGDQTLQFIPIDGRYRIIANFEHKYFKVLVLDGNSLAMLKEDGTGVIWAVGNVGNPTIANMVEWNDGEAICLAPMGNGIYKFSGAAGHRFRVNNFEFKLISRCSGNVDAFPIRHPNFSDNATDPKYAPVNSDVFQVTDGNDIHTKNGWRLQPGSTYTFTIDASDYRNITISLEENGETPALPPSTLPMTINGVNLNKVSDGGLYQADLNLTQNAQIAIGGVEPSYLVDWWIDPDFIDMSTGAPVWVPVTGKYRITVDIILKYFKVEVMDGSNLAVLKADGSGAIWVIGEDFGKPSIALNAAWWGPESRLCLSPIGNKRHQITLVAGKSINDKKINFKFFKGNGWDGEYSATTLSCSSPDVFVGNGSTPDYLGNNVDSGNLGLLRPLEAGATYVFVVDVTGGMNNSTLTVTKVE